MKVLQIENTKEPIILEAGFDFDIITATGKLLNITNSNPLECDTVCSLDDCYQQAPLNRTGHGDIYDFDLFKVRNRLYLAVYNQVFDCFESIEFDNSLPDKEDWITSHITELGQYIEIFRSEIPANAIPLDSIFTKENKLKYPELYTLSLELINEFTI